MIVETNGIILRSMKYGDTSKIVTCYTKQFGLIKILAKGARSAKSKFGSSLEPLSESHLVFYKKRGKDLNLLSKSEVINSITHFINDSGILIEALSVIEIFYRIHLHEEKNEYAYQILSETLKALSKNKLNKNEVIVNFYLNLCNLFGVSLSIDCCDKCNLDYIKTENIESSYFIFSNGTLICDECYKNQNQISTYKIEGRLLQQLVKISKLTPEEIVRKEFPKLNFAELKQILFKYITLHIEGVKQLKSELLI